jgi:hypothetical protein
MRSPVSPKGVGAIAADMMKKIFTSDIGMDADVDIGTLPILEGQFSVRHIFSYIGKTDADVGCQISPT